jgi:SH3-like domain-containing protein
MQKRNLFIYAVILLITGLIISQPVWAERLSVKSSIANVRSGPGTQNQRLWQVEKHHPFDIIKKKGAWYQFRDFEGDEGWVHNSLLTKTPTVIVVKPKCNVRSGPGTNYELLFTVEKGVPFKVLERKGNWIHVVHADGDKGWMHKSLIW